MISESLLEHLLKKYRWIFVIFFLLPLTFFYDIYHFIRQQVTEYFKDKSVCHDLKVKHVQGQVSYFKDEYQGHELKVKFKVRSIISRS
jgi:hypothetical protein